MAGRKPKPTALKVLQGNPGKRALPKGEPKPKPSMPKPPPHLGEIAKAEWKRVAKLLYGLGLLTDVDRAALAAYAQAYERWVQAEKVIAEDGLTTVTEKGNIIQHPAVGVANTAMAMMHKFLTEFGMTPSSRAKVTTTSKDEGKKSKWAI